MDTAISSNILTIDALTRRFGDLVAVDAVTASIERGGVFGLLGRNGAGKSTLIKMLTTLLPPTSGTAHINGLDIVRDAAAVRHAIGYVPQSLSADGELTGFENLLVFAKLFDIPATVRTGRIHEGLTLMGLEDAAQKLVSSYSGGMIRRLEIARSLLHRPQVLFLDEPTVGLDPVARDAVWDHIQRLQATFGTTLFLTTHYMEEAERLCARIAIMRRGRIVTEGTMNDLRRTYGDPGASLEEIFAHFTEDSGEDNGSYRETATTRQTVKRLG
jgi:ABC-2 type transport system ATP-binding protein